MNKNTTKISFGESFQLHLRAYHDIRKVCPKLFPTIMVSRVVKALTPYVTIYFSAQIIHTLTSHQSSNTIWFWVLLTISSSAVLSILNAVFLRLETVELEVFYLKKEKIFSDKMFSLDFADIDKPETHDLRSKILQVENWNGWGFNQFPYRFTSVVESCMGILCAVVLTFSLFTTPIPENAGTFTILNHPVFVFIFILFLILITTSVGMCNAKALTYVSKAAENATLGNRIWAFFGYLGEDSKRALDIRIYNQQDLALHYKSINNSFLSTGPLARYARGPMGIYRALANSISAILTGGIYLFTCLKAWAGAFGIGSVTQYVGAVTALSRNLSTLIEMIGYMQTNATFLQTVYQLLDIPNSMYQGSLTTEKRSDRNYEVEFKNVSFKYPNTDTWALRNVSVKFKVGNRLAVVGENGSGKTTFIKLLCRLYDPQEGEILLNGINIRKYNYRDYMNIFSVVFQDFQLLSQPLGSNVAGSMNYDEERVLKSLRDAGFEERLKELPDGLDTQLYKEFGESNDGVNISGGEAQKIAIARALYKNAPFLILDEPTAALDPIAEAEIYAQLNQIVNDRTAIYISHRLSSCRFCDEILVFDNGEIIQAGSHDSLVAVENGKYYELWHAQAKYYTSE